MSPKKKDIVIHEPSGWLEAVMMILSALGFLLRKRTLTALPLLSMLCGGGYAVVSPHIGETTVSVKQIFHGEEMPKHNIELSGNWLSGVADTNCIVYRIAGKDAICFYNGVYDVALEIGMPEIADVEIMKRSPYFHN